jgi:hypothetical protein
MSGVDDDAIDVHLADGGHVIVAFADGPSAADGAGDGILSALIHAQGTEHDLEQAIVVEATAAGFRASVSATHHPTTVVIESAAPDRPSPPSPDRASPSAT